MEANARLMDAVPAEVAERLQQKRRVFVDTRFEVGNEDFWQAHIEPALARSAQLIVLSSPDALQKLPDGTPNWVDREIDTFYDLAKRRDKITLALCPAGHRKSNGPATWFNYLGALGLGGFAPVVALGIDFFPGRARAIDDVVTRSGRYAASTVDLRAADAPGRGT